MKKSIIALLFAIIAFVTSFSNSTAVAAPLQTDQTSLAVHPDTQKTFAVGEYSFTFKNFTNSVSKDTKEDFSVAEITIAPQSKGFLLDKHVINVAEDFYALAGEFKFFGFQPDKTIKVNSGDIVHIPAGMPYGYKNVGSEAGKMLLLITSKGFENFIEEIGTPVADKSSIPSNSIQPDMNKIASVARKYGIEFLN